MARELKSIDITHTPELLRLAEEVQATGEPQVLIRESEALAVIMPMPKRRARKGKGLTEDDPLFRSIGSGRSGIPGGASGRKHEYLARAYRPR